MKRAEIKEILCVPSNYAIVLLNFVESQGISAEKVIIGTHIRRSILDQPEGQIPIDKFYNLLDKVDEHVKIPGFWLYYGKHLTLAAHGVLGHTIMNCNDLSDVIDVLYRYYKIQLPFIELDLSTTSEHTIISLQKPPIDTPAISRGPEILFASLSTNIKLLLNQNKVPLSFTFNFPPPAYLDVYGEILGSQYRFDEGQCCLYIPNELLDTKSIFSNPAMKKMYEQQCEQLLESLKIDEDPVSQVRKYLLSSPGQFPSCEDVAEELKISVSTLRRRLKECDTSFQAILDDARTGIALQYLQSTHYTVDEISTLMGFKDTSNFRRAFVKWTGRVPSSYRG